MTERGLLQWLAEQEARIEWDALKCMIDVYVGEHLARVQVRKLSFFDPARWLVEASYQLMGQILEQQVVEIEPTTLEQKQKFIKHRITVPRGHKEATWWLIKNNARFELIDDKLIVITSNIYGDFATNYEFELNDDVFDRIYEVSKDDC